MDWQKRIEELAGGYQDAAILLSALRCGLFDVMDDVPRPPRELAAALELDPRAVDAVLHAMAALGVVEKSGDGFTLPADRAAVLRRDGAASRGAILRHHQGLLQRWAHLDEVLRTGRPRSRDREDPEQVRDYIGGMADIQRQVMPQIAAAVDLGGARSLLDLGGGPGTAAIHFALAHPELRCTVFDQAGPLAIAREFIAGAGVQDRVALLEGDFLADPLPVGFDAAYLSNIIHIYGETEVAALFRKVHGALAPGGLVLVKDFYLDDDRTAPLFAARFAVNMLVGTETGTAHVASRVRAMLVESGFALDGEVPVGGHSTILRARRLDGVAIGEETS